jgi:Type IV secretion system pilin
MKKYVVRLSSILLTGIFPILAYAQSSSGLVKCGPQGNQQWCELKDLFELLIGIYNFLLGMAGIVAFGLLIWGGIQMLLYSVDEEHVKQGKSTVLQALIGLAIILLAYIVVNTLLVVLGVTDGPGGYFSGAKFLGGS